MTQQAEQQHPSRVADFIWKLQEREHLPVKEQNSVRVITVQPATSTEAENEMIHDLVSAFSQTSPNAADTSPLLPRMPHVTRSVWIEKMGGKKSNSPGQIMNLGGKIPSKSSEFIPPTREQIEKQALRQVWEKLHLNGSLSKAKRAGNRVYEFRHHNMTRRRNPSRYIIHEHLAFVEVSPYDRVIHPDPKDRIQAAHRLTDDEVLDLMITDVYTTPDGKKLPLLDSLSSNQELRRLRHVKSISHNEAEVKERIGMEVSFYELNTQREVALKLMELVDVTEDILHAHSKLLVMPFPSNAKYEKKMRALIQQAMELVESSYTDESLEQASLRIPVNTFKQLTENGHSEEAIMRRMKLIDDMSIAVQQVALEKTYKLTEQTGPQQPFIMAQMLTTFERLGPTEVNTIFKSPYLKHIYAVPMKVFGISGHEKNWYEQLLRKLKHTRDIQNSRIPEDEAEYEAIENAFNNLFIKTDIPGVQFRSVLDIGRLSKLSNDFDKYMSAPLMKFADHQLISQFLPDVNGYKTSQIIEVYFRIFGLSQYRDPRRNLSEADQEAFLSHPMLYREISQTEQYAAFRKLLFILTFSEMETAFNSRVNAHIFPFRYAFNMMFGEKWSAEAIGDGLFFCKYIMDDAFKSQYRDILPDEERIVGGIDVADFRIITFFDEREKDLFSLVRKWLERGGNGSSSEQIDDFFGFFFGLDDESMKTELLKNYPHLESSEDEVSEIMTAWKRFASKLIMTGIQDILISQFEGLDPRVVLKKGRESDPLRGLVPMEGVETGSAASKSDWSWIKTLMVFSFNVPSKRDDIPPFRAGSQTEIQILPSREDMRKKKLDDPEFGLRRMFERYENRYPTSWIMYGIQDEYNYLLEQLKQSQTDAEEKHWYDMLLYLWYHANILAGNSPEKEKQ